MTTSFDPYSFDDLLRAHALMMDGLVKHPGCLRNGDVGVYAGEVLIHAGSPASVVPQLMRELFEWLGTAEDHPLVKGSVFHYEFEFIHPFMDGNGRTGRLWHSMLLRAWRPVFAWLPVETLIHRSQAEYYDALLEAGQQADSTVFVEFMLRTIRDALKDALRQQTNTDQEAGAGLLDRRLAAVGGDRAAIERRLAAIGFGRVEAVIRAAEKEGSITAPGIASLLGLKPTRAREIASELVRLGLLRRMGTGRYTRYELADEG